MRENVVREWETEQGMSCFDRYRSFNHDTNLCVKSQEGWDCTRIASESP
jgi:hypothetical protein